MTISAGDAKTAARAAIDAAFGPIPTALLTAEKAALETARDNLAQGIASQATYVQSAAIVNSAIPVQVVPVTGTGATTAPGSLS
jgi:hypothetical protein